MYDKGQMSKSTRVLLLTVLSAATVLSAINHNQVHAESPEYCQTQIVQEDKAFDSDECNEFVQDALKLMYSTQIRATIEEINDDGTYLISFGKDKTAQMILGDDTQYNIGDILHLECSEVVNCQHENATIAYVSAQPVKEHWEEHGFKATIKEATIQKPEGSLFNGVVTSVVKVIEPDTNAPSIDDDC